MEYTRRYLMDGLHNLRDLGGYAVPGGVTRYGVLLRSDLPWLLTEDDGKRFAALGVRHTLDLRDVDESETMPDELALLEGVTYRQIAMKRVARAVARSRPGGVNAFDDEFFWGDEYIRMLEDNRPWAKECMEYLAAAEETVLFHCFTGKDRTGILSALVLGVCGASSEDIAADYSVSQIYLQPLYRWMRENIPDFAARKENAPFFSTAGENILAVCDHLEKEYGGTEQFLRECGVGTDALDALRCRLIKKA